MNPKEDAGKKSIFVASCICGEDVFSDDGKKAEDCGACGRSICADRFDEVEVANITKETIKNDAGKCNKCNKEKVKHDRCGKMVCETCVHTCSTASTPPGAECVHDPVTIYYFDTLPNPIELIQCRKCKEVWARPS